MAARLAPTMALARESPVVSGETYRGCSWWYVAVIDLCGCDAATSWGARLREPFRDTLGALCVGDICGRGLRVFGRVKVGTANDSSLVSGGFIVRLAGGGSGLLATFSAGLGDFSLTEAGTRPDGGGPDDVIRAGSL